MLKTNNKSSLRSVNDKDKKNFEFNQCKGPNYTVGLQPQLLEGLSITHNTSYQYLCHGKRYYVKRYVRNIVVFPECSKKYNNVSNKMNHQKTHSLCITIF